jgi:uncharacterized delta-60 repeat protein
MALQSDGKIVVVGTATIGQELTSNYKQGIEIVRYNPNGTLDTTFAGTGETTTYIDGQVFSKGRAVAVQPDGKIVAAGSASGELILIRTNADGTLDSGFGVDGRVITQSVRFRDWGATTAAVLPNGDLAIGGLQLLAWYDFKGNLLNVRSDVPGDVSSIGIVPNGDLFAGGQSSNPQEYGAYVIRYLSPGNLDTSFGSDGVATWLAGPGSVGAATHSSVTVLPNGQALATQTGGLASDVFLARLTELTTLHDAPDDLVWFNGSYSPPVFAHQSELLEFAVHPVVAGGVVPTGTVTLTDGGTVLGSATLDNTGQATFSTTALAVGTHSIEAQYAGDSHFAAATPKTTLVIVNPRPTAVHFTASPTAPQYGQLVTLTATVTASDPIPPTGTVTFTDGATFLGTATLDASGKAVLATAGLRTGFHKLSAAYGGDNASSPSSSSPLVLTVARAQTATSLASSADPAAFGQPITFTATIRSLVGVGYAFGTVTFYDGGEYLGTALVNGLEQARLTVTNLAAGSHAITAEYSGSSLFLRSDSATLTQQVLPPSSLGGTLAVLSISPAQLVFGQIVTLTASVTSGYASGKPTGTVTFLDGVAQLGTAAVDATGHASWAGRLNLGQHTLRAVYGGDPAFAGCTSPPVYEVVAQAPTTTVLTGPASPAAIGQPLTFTATVSPAFSGSPIGTVTFFDGSTELGTARVNGAGHASFTTTTLATGTHQIRAQYSGSSLFVGGWSDPFTVLVG